MWGFGMVSKVISNLCEISTGSFCTAKHAVAFIHSACHVILQRLARIKYNPQGHKSLNKSNLCKFRSFFVHNSYQWLDLTPICWFMIVLYESHCAG